MQCPICHGARWVCETHIDKPWDGASDHADACHCGGAGMPCPGCNWPAEGEPPEMPEGYRSFTSTSAPPEEVPDLDDLDWVEFDPGDEPSVLTTPNLCALFGGCERCPGFASVEATGLDPNHSDPAELVYCTHKCHMVGSDEAREL